MEHASKWLQPDEHFNKILNPREFGMINSPPSLPGRIRTNVVEYKQRTESSGRANYIVDIGRASGA